MLESSFVVPDGAPLEASSAVAEPPTEGIQIHVALRRWHGAHATSLRRLLSGLAPVIRSARDGGLTTFWYRPRGPGVQLRLRGPALSSGVPEAVDEVLSQLRHGGFIGRWSTRPDGAGAIEDMPSLAVAGAHRWCDADTATWLDWQQRVVPAGVRITTAVLSLAVVVDLFGRGCGHRSQQLRAWRTVARARGPIPTAVARLPALSLGELARLERPAVIPVLARYRGANARLATQLTALRDRVDPAQVLAQLASSHFDRLGLGAATIARIGWAMVAACAGVGGAARPLALRIPPG
ncbi:MAG: hypothetical protein K0V04_42730 [Deltaproteobacteria bacterium]|nr:hypothetical protein [Deltaproteobacteria bacterium]